MVVEEIVEELEKVSRRRRCCGVAIRLRGVGERGNEERGGGEHGGV